MMQTAYRFFLPLLTLCSLLLSSHPAMSANYSENWEEILAAANGQTVDWYMWGGSPAVNSYINGYVAKSLKEKYNINLRQVPVKDIGEVISKLLVEKQAGKDIHGSVDLMWINGENFRTCKKKDLLSGPFLNILPNSKYLDPNNQTILNDFGTPVEGMESPWGSAQVIMMYDKARLNDPPKTIASLIAWIKENPGKFTYPAPPDFTGSAFLRHIFYHFGGPVEKWQGDYSQTELEEAAQKTFDTLIQLKPYLWRQGRTYPDSPVRLNTLFADGEIELSFSYNQSEASRNIDDGLFPDTVRSYIFENGTIANTHFVAIPFNSNDSAGAVVTADFLLSPEAQLQKAHPDVWGDFPVISTALLDQNWQNKFTRIPKGIATLPDHTLQAHQLPEPPSQILIYLEKGWQEHVLKGR